MKANGTVFKYGDNVNTDVIIPARYLNIADRKELATHCMEDIDTEFVKQVAAGDIMVGGENFGCGSSREHAPMVIKESGIDYWIYGHSHYNVDVEIGNTKCVSNQLGYVFHGEHESFDPGKYIEA